MRKYTVALLLTFSVVSAPAMSLEVPVSTTYHLGDGDSRISAREMALISLKHQAAKKSGTFILGEETLQNDTLRESITAVKASMVSFSNLEESFAVNPEGRLVLSMSGTAHIDDKELAARARTIGINTQRARDIDLLARRNRELQRELDIFKAKLLTVSSEDNQSIIKTYNRLQRELSQNLATINQSFAAGSLLQLAEQNEVSSSSVGEAFIQHALGTGVVATIKNSRIVGSSVAVDVSVNYEYHPMSVPGLEFQRKAPFLNGGLVDIRPAKFMDLAVHNMVYPNTVYVRVQLASKVIEFPILYPAGEVMSDTFCYQLIETLTDKNYLEGKQFWATPSKMMHSFKELHRSGADMCVDVRKTRDITFHISKEEAATATGIKSTIHRIKHQI